MAERCVWVGGRLIAEDRARVPAMGGVLYGYGLFETIRAHGGRPAQVDAHYARLLDGARALGLHVPFDAEVLRHAIDAVLARNGLIRGDASVRLTLEGSPPADGDTAAPARWFVSARTLTEYPEELYERGASAIVSDVRRNETSPLSRLKTLNCLDNLLARRAARAHGADEAILLNTRGMVAEGSASNVFIVRGLQLLTPPVEAGALPGIARATVLELAPSLGLHAVEAAFGLAELWSADEVILTNSLLEVVRLARVDGKAVGTGRESALAPRLRALMPRI